VHIKDQPDEVLISLVAANDSAAFAELYDRYAFRLVNYFQRMLGGNQDKAQDFLHDLFVKLMTKAATFRSGQKFSTWLYTIAHNMCRNEYRHQHVKLRAIQNGNVATNEAQKYIEPKSDQNLDQSLFDEALKAAIDTLDTKQKSTFILRFQQNLSIKEISHILDCSEGTIKSRLHYTTKNLMHKLKDYNPFI
jgi:RNA polymerase sigma-70 factor (ECF subfamily)